MPTKRESKDNKKGKDSKREIMKIEKYTKGEFYPWEIYLISKWINKLVNFFTRLSILFIGVQFLQN